MSEQPSAQSIPYSTSDGATKVAAATIRKTRTVQTKGGRRVEREVNRIEGGER